MLGAFVGPRWKPEEGALGSDLKERKIKIEGERESPTGNKNNKYRNRDQDVDVLTGYTTRFFKDSYSSGILEENKSHPGEAEK